MSEAEEAGRLELPVVADLSGFRRDLRRKLEKETKGLTAKIGVELDADGLRERLKAVVDEAAAGVTANVEVKIDKRKARRTLSQLFSRGEKIKVGVDGKGGIVEEVVKATTEAQAAAEAAPVEVPVTGKNRLRARLAAWIAEAQVEAAAKPVEVPVKVKAPRGRALFRGALIGSALALIQPAISAIGGAIAGVVALGGPLGQAIGSLTSAVPLLGALVGIGVAGFLGFSGFAKGIGAINTQLDVAAGKTKLTKAQAAQLNKELAKLSPSARAFATELVKATRNGPLKGFRRDVQESLFAALDPKMIAPLLKAVNTLRPVVKGLAGDLGGLLNGIGKDLRTSGVPAINTLLQNTRKFLQGATPGLRAFSRGFFTFLAASSPILDRLGKALTVFGDRFEGLVNRKAADGSTLAFLDRAADKASQFGRIIRDLSGGLIGIFKGASEAGEKVAFSLEIAASRFTTWANSVDGQNSIRDYFNDMLPTFYEMVGLIGDIGKALGRMSRDPDTPKMIRQIREQLLPALERFLTVLGNNLGPKVIDLLSTLADIFANLGQAGGGIADVVTIIDQLAEVLNKLLKVSVGGYSLGDVVGQLLGLFVAYKAAKGVGKFLGLTGLATGLAALGGGAVKKGLAVLSGLKGLGGLGKVLGSFDGGTGGGPKGRGATVVDKLKDAFSKKIQVYWTGPMPVTVVNGGGGVDLDPTGVDKDGKPKKPGKKPRKIPGKAALGTLTAAGTLIGAAYVGNELGTAAGKKLNERADKSLSELQKQAREALERTLNSTNRRTGKAPDSLQLKLFGQAVKPDKTAQALFGRGKDSVNLTAAYDFLKKYGDKTKETRELVNALAKDPTVARELTKRAQAGRVLADTLAKDIAGKGTTAGQGFTKNLTSLINGGFPALRAAGDAAGNAAGSALPGKGRAAATGFLSGLRGKLADGLAAVRATADLIAAGLADGIARGLNARAERTLALAGKFGAAAANAVRHGAEVESPSKITTYVGTQMAEGVGVGLKQRYKAQLKIARHLGRGVAEATSAGVGRARFTPGSLRAGGGTSALSAGPGADAGSALVGGDLNLNMAEADPVEALQTALFELRRIGRGGVHVGSRS